MKWWICFNILFLGQLSVWVHADGPETRVVSEVAPSSFVPTLWCTEQFALDATIEDVRRQPKEGWELLSRGVIHRFLPKTPQWCFTRVHITDSRSWLLGINSAQIQEIDVFQFGESFRHDETGIRFAHPKRPIEQRHFFFPLISSSVVTDVYIRLMGPNVYAPFEIVTVDEMQLHESHQTALAALVAGMIIPLFLGLLLTRGASGHLSVEMRILGVLLIAAYWMVTATMLGYSYMEFWPNAVRVNQLSLNLTYLIFLVIIWRYLDVIFQVNRRSWDWVILALGFLVLLTSLLFSFTDSTAWLASSKLLTLLGGGLLLYRLVVFALTPKATAKHRLWLLWTLIFVLTSMQNAGYLYLFLDIDLMCSVNFAFLVLLFSWDVYITIRKNQAQLVEALENTVAREAELSILQRQRANELEEKVKERTQALANTMKDLHMMNVRLRAASSTDALTGVMNRSACDQYIESHWHTGHTFSMAFIDADFFKKINDTYGHDAGDACLQFLATCLTNATSNPKMRVARFGGEEFVMIAPGIHGETLYSDMEIVRKNIEKATIECLGHTIQMTVSIGLSSTIIDDEISPKALIKQADLAVYQAKKEGRNRTVVYRK